MDKGKEIINEPFWMHPDNEKEIIGNNKMNGIYIKGISMPNGGTLKIEIGFDADGHPIALTENHDVFDVIPVVLCCDCQWYGGREWEDNETGICARTDCGVAYDSFCSAAKRKRG